MPSSFASSRATYSRLLAYVRPYWRIFALALLCMAATAATEPLFPALMKPLLDGSFAGGESRPQWYFPVGIVGIFLVRGMFNFIASYGVNWVAHRVITDVRGQMFEHLVRLPTGYYNDASSGRTLSKIAYDVSGLAAAATSVLTTLVRDSLTILGLLGWLFYLNWQLTLVTLIIIPGVGLAVRIASRRLRRLAHTAQDTLGGMVQALDETISGHKVVKVFGGQQQEIDRFRRISEQTRGLSMRMMVASELLSPMVQLFAAAALGIVVYVALGQAATAGTTVGGFVSFITAMLMLLAPLKRLTDVNAPLQRGLAAAESVFGLIDETPEPDTGRAAFGRARGRLELRDVTFRYPGIDTDALTAINLLVEPGRTVALVGGSGGGKTTLANLVPRFYPLGQGTILLDGVDIASMRLADLRANIALVSQEIILFNDTIAANIAYGEMRGASRAALEAAARAAHAEDFIRALPQGFDTLVGENGVKLSGGQRQRLAIARAILKDAPLLILDEATSALDSESERQVQAALEELMRGRTTLVIAHRLSTVERADEIVVLQKGRIVERGRHAELLASEGSYAQLYRLQFAEAGA